MSIHYPVLAQFFLPHAVRFELLNCEHACYSGIVLPLSLTDCSHSQSGLDVSAHGFCGVKHLVLRGVNHNRNKNSLTCVWIQACLSSRLCLSYSITFINGGMAVKLICWGGKHWQTSQRYTGPNWADKYHRLRSLALQHCCIHHPECKLTTSSGVPPACLVREIYLLPKVQLKSRERFPLCWLP